MPEIIKEKPEISESEREELERLERKIISFAEFEKISEEILKQHKEDPESIKINRVPQVIEKIIDSFPTKETKQLCRKIIAFEDPKEIISLLKDIKPEIFEILKEKIDEWIKLTINEFCRKRDKDLPKLSENDHGMVDHFWTTPLQAIYGVLQVAEDIRQDKKD